ncbi:flavin-containing monooxygenase [Trujillonella endophytica]|uniref:4-hydroxyacetophenone monooxygenase n=1 Tax=Trujillonella endophytica TaxID=673521 RepID=A0A1H8US10_9ACTN|nr:NAD(P)/FAD-dependent oxidoreductase [Trujillella endophytica]SEP05378.1 4-hydroxyacetophenone monooxygenase [Trujillella endophytica]
MTRGRPELLEAGDETIDDAVRHADPMVLRGLLYQLTGDEELVDVPLAMTVVGGCREMYRIAERSDVERIRAKAAAFLREYRDSGAGDLPIGPRERLHRSLSLTAGVEVDPRELELWVEELALDPLARGLRWPEGTPPEGTADFSVLVIGAGMGGLNAAALLKQAGIAFTVLEKNSAVGGTWYENRYPGARVDSPSRVYTHVYGVDFPHPYPYCPQEVNEGYFNWVADTFDLRDAIRLHTEVTSIVWDDAEQVWEVTAEDLDGTRTWRANAVISAVGFLSRPNIPKLPGIEQFRGRWCHTARWPADLDLTGARVAVIGTGCTGYQLIPEIVADAEHVYVFQRSPNWIYHAPGYLDPYPDQVTWLDRNLPYLTNFSRFSVSYMQRPQNTLTALLVDPDFADEHAVSAVNKAIRDERMAFLRKKLGSRPDLLEAMTPTAPPMSARPVLVDQDHSILDMLLRDDVTLETRGVRRVTEDAVELPDGTRHEVDVIVLATGFRANDFLWPMEVRGRGGRRIEELWAKDGARAYLGSMLPGFPNFFMVYGPNTNTLSGMQVVDMEELTTRFALESIAGLLEQRRRSVEVTEDAYWRFNGVLDAAEQFMTYMDPRQSNYYQNDFGRSAANNPLDTRLLWNWLRDPAGRRTADAPLEIDETLLDQYDAVHPRFGADLVVE